MNLPKLQVPSQDISKRPRPYLRRKDLQVWAESLPLANAHASGIQFAAQCNTLNRSAYPAEERFEQLLTLQDVLANLQKNMTMPLRNFSLPLEHRQMQLVEVLQTGFEGIATGYKLIFSELAAREQLAPSEQFLLIESLFYAMHFLGQRQLVAYTFYQDVPAHIWQELNQLYFYAEQKNLLQDEIDNQLVEPVANPTCTIENLYKQLLLTATTQPNHLMQMEIEVIYKWMGHWSDKCQLLPANVLPTFHEYVLDLATDCGPKYEFAESTFPPAGTARILDLSGIRKKLDQHLQKLLRDTSAELEFSAMPLQEWQERDTLLRLADSWHNAPARNMERFKINSQVHMALGLNAAHHYISDENTFTPAMDELKLAPFPDDGVLFTSAYQDALTRDKRHQFKSYTLNPWSQHNISPNGIALRCHACYSMQARVGEVVAYLFQGKKQQRWHLGVIRWLRNYYQSAETKLDLGIMNLATRVLPVAVRRADESPGQHEYRRCLYIYPQPSLKQPRSLLLPAYTYDIGSTLTLNMKKRVMDVRLTRVLRSTRAFAQFEFEPRDPHSELPD